MRHRIKRDHADGVRSRDRVKHATYRLPCELDARNPIDAVVHAARLVERHHEAKRRCALPTARSHVDRQQLPEWVVSQQSRVETIPAAEEQEASALLLNVGGERTDLHGVEPCRSDIVDDDAVVHRERRGRTREGFGGERIQSKTAARQG
jgi:hypothetical protein